MYYLSLIRARLTGKAIRGTIYGDGITCQSDTVENVDYYIPASVYELDLHTWSRSGKLVPKLLDVEDRTGILIHNGYPNPRCSTGCILTNQAMVDWLVRLIQKAKTEHEKVFLRITYAPALGRQLCELEEAATGTATH